MKIAGNNFQIKFDHLLNTPFSFDFQKILKVNQDYTSKIGNFIDKELSSQESSSSSVQVSHSLEEISDQDGLLDQGASNFLSELRETEQTNEGSATFNSIISELASHTFLDSSLALTPLQLPATADSEIHTFHANATEFMLALSPLSGMPIAQSHNHGNHGGTEHMADMQMPITPAEIEAFVEAVKSSPEMHVHDDHSGKMVEHMAAMALTDRAEATHIAISDGDWNDPQTWYQGNIPGDDARALIPEGIEVSYGAVNDARLFTLRVDGKLDFATDVDSKLVVDTAVVSPTGVLIIGTEETPVQAGVDIDIVFANNGAIDTGWDPMLLSRGLIAHGEVEIHGTEKDSHAKVVEDPMAGDTSVKFESVPTGWAVGDTIIIAGTEYEGYISWDPSVGYVASEDEERIITAIKGDQVFFEEALLHDHDSPRADLKTSVANYTRNVSFETEDAINAEVFERGHVMFMHNDNVDVRYVEFHELGRTDKSEDAFNAGEITDIASDSNVKGRYALHLHRAGTEDHDNPAIVEGNAVYGSPGWGFVHHDSHAVLENNASFNTFGAGYVAESGNETGAWHDNIAILAKGMSWQDPKGVNAGPAKIKNFDMGRSGDGFWFQGRMVESTDNVAASVHNGFVYFHRGAIGENANLRFDADTSPIEGALNYADDLFAERHPIIGFNGNETFAAKTGLYVLKATWLQTHDVHSVVEDFTAWSVRDGADLSYSGLYVLKDFDLVARGESDLRGDWGTGIKLGNNLIDITVVDANIEGFATGINLNKTITNKSLSPDINNYTIINANFIDVDEDYRNLDLEYDTIIDHDDLPKLAPNITLEGPLSYNHDHPSVTPGGRVVEIKGTKSDSLGSTDFPSDGENYSLSATEVRDILQEKGYYTDSNGQAYFVLDIFFSDRATGDIYVEKHPVFVHENAHLDSPNNGFFRDVSYNGMLELGGLNDRTSETAELWATIKDGKIVLLNDHEDNDSGGLTGSESSRTQEEIEAFVEAVKSSPEMHVHDDHSGKMVEHMAAMALTDRAEATHIAISDGDWNDPQTWYQGNIPGDDARALIPEGIEVSYGAVNDARLFTLRVDGKLDFATDVDSKLVVDTAVVSPTGVLIIGTEETPVQAGVDIDIVFANNGAIDTGWDPMLLSRGLIAHGEVEIHGTEKDSHAKVVEDPMAGDTSVKFESVPTGWAVGDTIIIAGTEYEGYISWDPSVGYVASEDEERIITAIKGDQVFFEEALLHDHDSPRADLKTSVANYTRNVSFETEDAINAEVFERGHVMFMHNDNVDVRYVEFHELGRTDKSEDAFNAGEITDIASDSNVKGRYALHLHRAGTEDHDNPAIVEGNAVYGSPGWGFVHHDSHAVLENNASFNTFGAGYVAESGNETGAWHDNIAILAKGMSWQDPKGVNAGPAKIKNFDMGRSGDGFWFQGRMVESTDNVAASVHNGFVYFHRGAIGENANLRFDADTSPIEGALNYADDLFAERHPIIGFNGNETFAAKTGLYVLKATWLQTHDVHSVVEDFTAWSVRDGADLSYSGLYVLKDFDLVARGESDLRGDWGTGIKLGNNLIDITVVDANIEGFATGINLNKTITNKSLSPDINNYTIINANFIDVDEDYRNLDLEYDTIIDHDDLPKLAPNITLEGPLSYNHDHPSVTPGGRVVEIKGTKSDSLGSTDFPSDGENYSLSATEVRDILQEKGYYTDSNGQAYFVLDIFFSDRATGDIYVEKHPVFVHENAHLDSPNNGFFRDVSYNGMLELGGLNDRTSETAELWATIKDGKIVLLNDNSHLERDHDEMTETLSELHNLHKHPPENETSHVFEGNTSHDLEQHHYEQIMPELDSFT